MAKYCFLLFFLLSACGLPQKDISPEAERYLSEVLAIMEKNSVKRKDIDWDLFRQNILSHASKARTIRDTYPAIAFAVSELGDNHSYFSPVDDGHEHQHDLPGPPLLPDDSFPADVGYIRIPYCVGGEEETALYIKELLQKMKDRDSPHIKGWIVDLRGNFGGNMWPMLVAIGPVLGEGTAGYFVDPDNRLQRWSYKGGEALLGDTVVARTDENYRLKKNNPLVAVLTDANTASSGEAITIAFKGRPRTKSFGEKTYGVSTGNETFVLSDGSTLVLTTTLFADRHMNTYGGPVVPDVQVLPGHAMHEAVKWIRQ